MLKLGDLHIFLRCSFIFTLKNRQTHRHTWIKYHSRYIYIYIYIIQINIGPSLRLVSRSLYDILVIRYGSGPSWSLFHLLVDQAIQSLVASPLSLKSHMIWGIVHVCSTPSLISAVWFIQIANLQQQWCSHGSVNTSKKRHCCLSVMHLTAEAELSLGLWETLLFRAQFTDSSTERLLCAFLILDLSCSEHQRERQIRGRETLTQRMRWSQSVRSVLFVF